MYIFALTMLMAPLAVSAEEVLVDKPVSSGLDIFFTIYLFGGSIFVMTIGWVLKKIINYLSVKIENETIEGIMRRLIGSITDAVASVDQTMRKELERSRAADSPGGSKITEQEKKQMFDAVWSVLKEEYGGWSGMFGLLKRIGIGNDDAAKAKIDTMIEAAVNSQKIRKKAMGPK